MILRLAVPGKIRDGSGHGGAVQWWTACPVIRPRAVQGGVQSDILHATAVADPAGRGILILGPSGAGKSALAWQLMALGARLVADDRTVLTAEGKGVALTCPPTIRGLIEARGIGLLQAEPVATARLSLAVDLGRAETERLPPRREILLLGHPTDLVLGPVTAHFPAALLHYLAGGRRD
jgi:HPr kinase/phosphorylase